MDRKELHEHLLPVRLYSGLTLHSWQIHGGRSSQVHAQAVAQDGGIGGEADTAYVAPRRRSGPANALQRPSYTAGKRQSERSLGEPEGWAHGANQRYGRSGYIRAGRLPLGSPPP